jgi:hypothetical protein
MEVEFESSWDSEFRSIDRKLNWSSTFITASLLEQKIQSETKELQKLRITKEMEQPRLSANPWKPQYIQLKNGHLRDYVGSPAINTFVDVLTAFREHLPFQYDPAVRSLQACMKEIILANFIWPRKNIVVASSITATLEQDWTDYKFDVLTSKIRNIYTGINNTVLGDRKWETQSITLPTMGLFGNIEKCWRQTFLEKNHSRLLTSADSIKIQKHVLETLHSRLQALEIIRKELDSIQIPAQAPPPPAAAAAVAPAIGLGPAAPAAIGLADAKSMAGPSFRSQFGFPVIPLGFQPVVGPLYPSAPPRKMDLTGGRHFYPRHGGWIYQTPKYIRGTRGMCQVHRK